MAKQSYKAVSGTRDFAPLVVRRRQFIFSTLRHVFELHGFEPIETPAFERLEVLAGKYGDEGDQLIYKILNSGDFLAEVSADTPREARAYLPLICEKALRYDLTVPFARYVANNRNDIALPFKRYQMQPVWRADRPQKGRYREFWQCDVDVVGSASLLYEAEFVRIYDEALSRLGLRNFTLQLNHRKLLQAVAEVAGAAHRFQDLCVAIDKLDKIGRQKVEADLLARGFEAAHVAALEPLFGIRGDFDSQLQALEAWLGNTPSGPAAFADLRELRGYLASAPLHNAILQLDATLARGLNYYTGLIFEVKANDVAIGSIGGGGRYDDLAGVFGWEGLPGVGVSFGADRIYDAMESLGLFPAATQAGTQVLVANFGPETLATCLAATAQIRAAGISAELYPDAVKLAKQFAYADKKGIPNVLVIGPEEAACGLFNLKQMATGTQTKLALPQVLHRLAAQNPAA